MGLLRIVLAISVILDHAGYHMVLIPGVLAVLCFFAVSGFYMQLILKNYRQEGPRWQFSFYKSRFLRIFPTYYLFLLLTLLMSLTPLIKQEFYFHGMVETFYLLDTPSFILFLMTNLGVFGLEILRFCVFDPVQHALLLSPMADFNAHTAGSHFIYIGQAWSISSELFFYLLVPFLLTLKTSRIIFIIALTIMLRLLLIHYKLVNENINYTFFPTNLGVFLTGSLMYRLIYLRLDQWVAALNLEKILRTEFIYWFFISLLILLCVNYKPFMHSSYINYIPAIFIHYREMIVYAIFFITVSLMLPFLFYVKRKSTWDRLIGDLSYPVYLAHMLVLGLVSSYFDESHFFMIPLLTVAISILVSIPIVIYFERPIDAFRHKKFDDKVINNDLNAVNVF